MRSRRAILITVDEIAGWKVVRRVPPEALEVGGVYQLHSRNLAFGVYAGGGEFIGIRTKFAKRFVEHYARNLDQEWDWDTHEGTATPLMKVGKIAEGIELKHGYNPPEGPYRMNQALFDALEWFEGTHVECCRCLHPHPREEVDFSYGPWRQPLCGWCSGAAENEDPGFVPVAGTEPEGRLPGSSGPGLADRVFHVVLCTARCVTSRVLKKTC